VSKKEKLLNGVGHSETEFCLCGVEGSKQGKSFVLLVHAWELDKDGGFLVTFCSRCMVGLFTHGKENIHDVAGVHRPLGILTCRFRHRRFKHEHEQALTRVRAGHRDSAVGRDIDSLAVLRPRLWNLYILCRCCKISLAQRIRNSTYGVMLKVQEWIARVLLWVVSYEENYACSFF